MMGPIVAVPEKFSCWNKVHVVGSKTIQEIFDFLKAELGLVNISMLACGKAVIYNQWCGNSGGAKEAQEKRLGMEMIAAYEDVMSKGQGVGPEGFKFPKWKSTLELVISAEVILPKKLHKKWWEDK
jgi:hypothetical protein